MNIAEFVILLIKVKYWRPELDSAFLSHFLYEKQFWFLINS